MPRHIMSRKVVINFINHLCLLLGLAASLLWLYFGQRVGSWRRALHPNPLVDLGLLSLAVWLFKQTMCWFYPSRKIITSLISLAMLQIIIVIMLVMGYAMVVTHKGEGRVIPGRAYKEYNFWDFSKELRRYSRSLELPMLESEQDMKVRMIESGVCTRFGEQFNHLTELEFYNTNLTPLQSGCCKPPSDCPYEFKNATVYKAKMRYRYMPKKDCRIWELIDPESYCLYCDSCRGAKLFNVKTEWREMVFTNILVVLSLLIFYFLQSLRPRCCSYFC